MQKHGSALMQKGRMTMADRKKVIEQLESMRDYHRSIGNNITADIANDAVELLKEQEAKPVDLYGKDDWYGLVCVCPDCKAEWMGDESETHFCPNCGRKVKWE